MNLVHCLRRAIYFSLLLFFVAGLFFGLLYRDFLGYGWGQLLGQWKLIQGARPIMELLGARPYEERWGAKLRLVLSIKRYAFDSLGLDTTDTYASLYVPPQGEESPRMWVVTAAEPYELSAYLWDFPFIGALPYKGFFDRNEAKAEEQRLLSQGYDTRRSKVSGWSTLGWIENPILPQMLDRSSGQLADLIIHELTHNTLYIKDNASFNENLASFIGKEGAIGFLTHYYGPHSEDLKDYRQEISDQKKWYTHWIRAAGQLDSLYRGLMGQSDTEKEKEKQSLLASVSSEVDTICFLTERWQRIQHLRRIPNNAFLMKFLRYGGQEDSLRAMQRTRGQSLRDYIQDLQLEHQSNSF